VRGSARTLGWYTEIREKAPVTRSQLLKERANLGGRKELPSLTAKELLESGVVGMWKDRRDIRAGSAFARELRERLSRRRLP
jgi:hypothetical protein